MAEQYALGSNRIFYRSKGFQENILVQGKFLNPAIVWTSLITLQEAGQGLYYLDIVFDMLGIWVGLFYEDSVKTTSQNFYVIKRKSSSSGNILNH